VVVEHDCHGGGEVDQYLMPAKTRWRKAIRYKGVNAVLRPIIGFLDLPDCAARKRGVRDAELFWVKEHVNADAKHKMIRRYEVTDAAIHDSQELDGLLTKANTSAEVFANSAYRSTEIEGDFDPAA
jgi:hypothetical protein